MSSTDRSLLLWLLLGLAWCWTVNCYTEDEGVFVLNGTKVISPLDQGEWRVKRLLKTDPNRHWPKGIIPYKYYNVDPKNKKDIEGSMAMYEYWTPLRFKPWSAEVEKEVGHFGFMWMRTTWGRGWSLAGFYAQRTGQGMDCPHLTTCLHEFGHALGMEHEQYHPERDRWIRINKGNLREFSTYKKLSWGTFRKTHFDYSSFMLYSPSRSKPYDVLFNEVEFEHRHFYMFKELCDVYGCAGYTQCTNHRLTCHNEGYVSVVDNRCACVCPPGLDPKSNCQNVLKKGPTDWPSGSFSLLQHKDGGCPTGNFQTGLWRHYGTGDNKHYSDSYKGDLDGLKAELSFCTKTSDTSNKDVSWPNGRYCFLKKGNDCPTDQKGIYEAKVTIPGRADTSENVFTGQLPSGTTGRDATLEFCCVHTGFRYIPAPFPSDKPFILFPNDRFGCQEVEGMSVRLTQFGLYGAKVEGDLESSDSGSLTYLQYCAYTPLDRGCGEVVEMGPNMKTFSLASDKAKPSNRECTWYFKGPNDKGTLVVDFDEFDVTSRNRKCEDSVEVQPTLVAQKGIIYCDGSKVLPVQSLFGRLRVTYRTGSDSKSSFKATIRWIPDDDLCYDTKDSGWSYRGTISHTRAFEKCLPWSETTSCLHHSMRTRDFLDGLESNYCRNPDGGFRPWCYTKVAGCERNFCDVCQLAKPVDLAKDCADRKKKGHCGANDVDCAKTCGNIQASSIKKASAIQCSRPGSVSGGDFVGQAKNSYGVGDIVTYKCSASKNTFERACLTTGKWSDANTACLPCPLGYSYYHHNCYKLNSNLFEWDEGVAECKKDGAKLAMPKTQEETDYIASLKYPINELWLGASYEGGRYQWQDGSPVTWFNWRWFDVPHTERCVYMREDDKWKSAKACYWTFNIICQIPAAEDNLECKDFMDDCPSWVNSVKDCDEKPGLAGYCRYSCGRCPTDCNQDVVLTTASPTHTITADRRSQSHRYCTWNVKAPNKEGRIVLHFTEFQVKSEGDNCVDSVEVRETEYGPLYKRHCDGNYSRSVVMERDDMLVTFRTPGNSASHFKAKVEWVPDSSMCYDIKDKGWSYNGPVSHTRTYKPCIAWSQAMTCVNNTLQNGYFVANLKDSTCRNPDGSDRPWCYTEDCEKEFCDVCHLEQRSDTSTNCKTFKASGKCTSNPGRAAMECAATCKGTQVAPPKVSQVTCPTPSSTPAGTTTIGGASSPYRVGDKKLYTCAVNEKSTVEGACLSTGAWSKVNTACLECPYGFLPFKDSCYKYVAELGDKDYAVAGCNKLGAVLATPKTEEQNEFISMLRNGERIYLGGVKRSDGYEWNDRTKVTWFNWLKPNREFKWRDNCMVMETDGTWTSDWCRDKLFQFVCQVKRQSDKADCADYSDVCPSLVQGLPDSDCTDYPSLQLYCRSSCGMCSKGCSASIDLTTSRPEYSFTADFKSGEKLCIYNFKGDAKKGRFVVTLEEFKMKDPDSLTMKESTNGATLHVYTEKSYKKTTEVFNNELVLQVKNTKSSFKATVSWTKDDSMCYNVKDKGWSYNGDVSYSKSFKPCLAWSKVLECPHNPLKNGDFTDNLEGNTCRNPDDSEQPWCYTEKCVKALCDVCHLEKPVDSASDCAQRKRDGKCTGQSVDCAKTCQISEANKPKSVADIQCSNPGRISGGLLQGQVKSQYSVGDVVTYKCSGDSSVSVNRVCLTSGQWSVANTACLECPQSFTAFKGNCYRFFGQGLNYTNAADVCKKHDSLVAMPKNKDQNDFLYEFSFKSRKGTTDHIWLGAQKNDKDKRFDWADNTPFSWTNWQLREPFRDRDKCIVMRNRKSKDWNDDWCRDKAFNFVCQRQANAKPECKDFLNDCPNLLALTGKSTCEADSRLETFCRHTCGLCPRNCDYDIKLNSANPQYTISSDRSNSNDRYCSWKFEGGSKAGRFVLQFESFDVKPGQGECLDVVDIRQTPYGSSQRLCNGRYQRVTEVLNDKMIVTFRTLTDSRSNFRASVKWVDDASMCYSVKDKGFSYNGKMSYTHTFQPCISWTKALSCNKNPVREEYFLNNLEENYCRNPDMTDEPWCYTEDCKKQYCDVCRLVTPFDTSNNCASFKRDGKCTSDKTRALKECAATCGAASTQTLTKVGDIACGSPGALPGAEIQGEQPPSYSVGDKVTYKCSRSASVVDRTCLTSGDWSQAKTACLECPAGWSFYGKKCYRYVNQFLEYQDAVYECKKMSAIVAPGKSKDEIKFITSFGPQGDYMWLGLSKSKGTASFNWSDGSKVTWNNWGNTKKMEDRDDCVLMYTGGGGWRDDWCNRKYFSFVCQMDSDDNPDCKDFVDSCPAIKKAKGDKCDANLNKFCRKTCGVCQ